MSETDFGREPVEIIEIKVPKCVNVHGTSPCTATQTGNGKCFNTRATCNDVSNFQARPIGHLDADLLLEEGDTGTQTENGSNAYFVEVALRLNNAPNGVVFEIGGTTDSLYIGFDGNNDLVARCGDATVSSGTDVAKVTIDMAAWFGSTVTLIVEASRIASTSQTITVYLYDRITLELYQLGTHTSSGDSGAIFGTGDYGVGTEGGTVPTGEVSTDYNSKITSAALFTNQTATLFPDAGAYRSIYYFDDGRKAKPSDDIYIIPLLQSVSTVGTRLNLTAADDRYEPLGRLAYMDISFADAPHSDFGVDPYRGDRSYDPLKRSTFWNKWLVRNKFGRTRALVSRYTGYDGQRLDQMQKQTYVLDRYGEAREQLSIRCRDVLSLTEFRRAQVPAPTTGKLLEGISAAATSLKMPGDTRTQYPLGTGQGDTIRINDELMTFSGISYDAGLDETTLTGLTRGTDGSLAAAHEADDGIQMCDRYTQVSVSSLLEELLLDHAQVPAQLVDLQNIQDVDAEYLNAYTLSTILSEPTGIDVLVGELARDCSFVIWWNERTQLVDMQAIVPLETLQTTLTQEDDILAESLSLEERPKERITTASIYYNPRNFAGDLRKPVNYKNQLLVANSSSEGPDQYGDLPQTREIFSRWLLTEAQANQTGGRYALRYADIPTYASLMVDAKDRSLWVGDYIGISHDYLVDARGERIGSRKRWMIIEAEEVEAGHAQRLVCVDVTLDGLIYLITDNGIGTYTEALFLARNAFITDNLGLNPDGSSGATIA